MNIISLITQFMLTVMAIIVLLLSASVIWGLYAYMTMYFMLLNTLGGIQ